MGAPLKNSIVTRHVYCLVRFCLVGISGVAVNITLLYLLTETGGLNHLVAAVFATEAAILNNFLLNDCWTFGDVESSVSWPWRVLRYNSVALVGLVISVTVLAGLTYLLSLHYLIANLFAICAGTLWNYAGSSYFAWNMFRISALSPVGVFVAPFSWGLRFVCSVTTGVSRLWS